VDAFLQAFLAAFAAAIQFLQALDFSYA